MSVGTLQVMGLALGLLLCAAGGTQAPGGAAGGAHAPEVALDIEIIEASNKPGDLTERLPERSTERTRQSRAARDLGSTLKFTSFRTLSEENLPLGAGESTTLRLPNGATATLTLLAVDPGKRTLRLRLQIAHGVRTLDTEYTVRDGGTVFVSAGNAGQGAVLVAAISPHTKTW